MEKPLTVHGTCKSHFTLDGNNGIAKVIVSMNAWWLEKKKDEETERNLPNISVNGHSNMSMELR